MAKNKKTEGSEKKPSKGKLKRGYIEFGLSLLSVGLGAWAGAAVGRPSLAGGIVLAGGGFALKHFKPDYEKLGHYTGLFGLGMTVGHSGIPDAAAPSAVQGLSGLDGWLEDATARAKAFGKGMVVKTYLDKIPAIAKATGTEGMGAAPSYYDANGNPMSMDRADALIKQLQQASLRNPVNGPSILEDLKGLAGTQASLLDFAA